MIRAIKQVYFSNGVMLSGSVRQSLAVQGDEADPIRYGGVHRVQGMEVCEFGVLVVDKGTQYLVPWHMVTSCVVDAVPETIDPAPPVDEQGRFIREEVALDAVIKEVAKAPEVEIEDHPRIRVDTRKKLPVK